MTWSEQLLLLRAHYGVLHVHYIVLFPLFSFRAAWHVLQRVKMYPEVTRIKANNTELG